MFRLVNDKQLPIDAVDHTRLVRLLDYWHTRCDGRRMPRRADIDPLDLREHIGRIHLIDVLGASSFRYRVYGSRITNPDLTDMTGKTTADYRDIAFGSVTTRHYQSCVEQRAPVYYHVLGDIDSSTFEFTRLVLPLSSTGTGVDMLISSPNRLIIPVGLPPTGRFENN